MVAWVKWHISTIILIQISHVIGNHVHHDPNISLVASIDEINEILLGAKIIVKLIKISAPIPMIASIPVLDNGTDPDRIEPHSLNVIQVVLQTNVPTSAVPA